MAEIMNNIQISGGKIDLPNPGRLPWTFYAGIIENIPIESYFLSKTFSVNEVLHPFDRATYQIVKGKRMLLPLGVYNDPNVRLDANAIVEEKQVVFPQIAAQVDENMEDIISRIPMFTDADLSKGSFEEEFNKSLARKMALLKDALTRTQEYLIAQVITTGKLDFVSPFSNRRLVVDFEIPSDQFINNIDWSNPSTATPITDLINLARKFMKRAGKKPNLVIMGAEALDKLEKSAQWNNERNIYNLKEMGYLQGIDWNLVEDVETVGNIRNVGNVIAYHGTYEDPATGTTKPYIPDDAIILTNTSFWSMHYGAVKYYRQPDSNPYIKTKIFVTEEVTEDKKSKVYKAETHPLPFLENPYGLWIIQVQ